MQNNCIWMFYPVSSFPQSCVKSAKRTYYRKKLLVIQSRAVTLMTFLQKKSERDRLSPIDAWKIDNRETWQRKESEKWIRVTVGRLFSHSASCPEKSIHHSHVFESWLTLAIASSVAMMTRRIDEVQAGGGAGVWVGDGQTRCLVRLCWDGPWGGDLMKVMMLLVVLVNYVCRHTWI